MKLKNAILPALLLAATTLSACDTFQSEAAAAPLPRPVKLILVDGATTDRTRSYPAVIKAADQTELSFQVGGLVQELPIKEGDEVLKGTLIAQLDQRDFRNQLSSSRAQFDNAEEEYQRAASLAIDGVISQSDLERLRSQRDIARAQLDSAEKALSDTAIRAPFDGQIASLNVRRLQSIKSGDPLATFISSNSLEAVINIPSNAIAGIPRDVEERRARFPVHVTLDAIPGKQFKAFFKEAEAIADAASQTYEVAFLFERPEDVLVLPGMNAIVEISDFPSAGAGDQSGVSVPLTAISSDGDKLFVWVYDVEAMTVSQRLIETAAGVGETLLVTSGLDAGETIVAAGTSYLSEGMVVRPWTD